MPAKYSGSGLAGKLWMYCNCRPRLGNLPRRRTNTTAKGYGANSGVLPDWIRSGSVLHQSVPVPRHLQRELTTSAHCPELSKLQTAHGTPQTPGRSLRFFSQEVRSLFPCLTQAWSLPQQRLPKRGKGRLLFRCNEVMPIARTSPVRDNTVVMKTDAGRLKHRAVSSVQSKCSKGGRPDCSVRSCSVSTSVSPELLLLPQLPATASQPAQPTALQPQWN